MTDVERGWSAHPDAIGGRAESPAFGGPVDPGSSRIVGLGAVCDLAAPGDDHTQSFSVGEFALLDNGIRVLLHHERGFTAGSPTGQVRLGMTRNAVVQDVLTVVLPDDDETGDAHPWSWLAELARARGLDVTAEDLRPLPYQVVLGENLTRWLEAIGRDGLSGPNGPEAQAW